MKRRYIVTVVLAMLLAAGCDNDENFVAPSFLHVEGIHLVKPQQGALSTDEGFYTHDIVAAYVAAHRVGAASEDTIGLFRMPFTVPVLFDGVYDYVKLYPAVMQSGKVNALPFYTYYNPIRIDSVALTSGDTLDLGTLTTTHESHARALMHEPFEPNEGSLLFDSVLTWVPMDPDGACTGYGYGLVHVDDTMRNGVRFSVDRTFTVTDPSLLLYLELDIKSDVEMGVYMVSSRLEGTNLDTRSVMNVYPDNTQWKHMYINLGRTWSYFNHNKNFRLLFHALPGADGKGGELRIDNVRVVTTPVTQ